MHEIIKIKSKSSEKITMEGYRSSALSKSVSAINIKDTLKQIEKLKTYFYIQQEQGYNFKYFPFRILYDKWKPKTKRLLNLPIAIFGKNKIEKMYVKYQKNGSKRKTIEIFRIKTNEFIKVFEDFEKHLNKFTFLLDKPELVIKSFENENFQALKASSNLSVTKIKSILSFLSNLEEIYAEEKEILDLKKQINFIVLENNSKEMLQKLNKEAKTFFASKGLNVINTGDIPQDVLEKNKFKQLVFCETINAGENFAEILEQEKSNLGSFEFKFDESTKSSLPLVGVIDSKYLGESDITNFIEVENKYYSCDKENKHKREHGTKISNIIVANDQINKDLKDDCDIIKVKHFNVCLKCRGTVANNLKWIYKIIEENSSEIKIWNLSFNVLANANDQQISFSGKVLDKIQEDFKVLIVNGVGNVNGDNKIAVMADSVYSLTTTGIDKNGGFWKGSRISYDYSGSYLIKPDLAYYASGILSVNSFGFLEGVDGVSYSTALISRKAAYIWKYVSNNPLIIKAFLINASALNSHNQKKEFTKIGFGVCPTKISDVVKSKNHEIKIYIEGQLNQWKQTYVKLPIPANDKFEYKVLLTITNNTTLSRFNGVEYIDYEIKSTIGFEDKNGKFKKLPLSMPNTEPDEFEDEKMQSRNYAKYKIVKHLEMKPNSRSKNYPSSEKKDLIIRLTDENRVGRRASDKIINYAMVITFSNIEMKDRYIDFRETLATRIDQLTYTPLLIEENVKMASELQLDIEIEK